MKKIFAILCGVTMMFAACTTPEGGEGVEPIFPQAVTAEVLAGDMYTLTFDANTAWTVSLENDYYAQLSYNNGEGTVFDTEVSGVAGEGIKVRVIVNEEIKNYDADVVIPVSITMGSTTQTLATLTVKQIERPAAIVINEIFETVTFAEGHPSYSEFHNAQKQYSLNYSDKWDLEGVSMTCNLEGDYAIKVHACNEGKTLVDVTSDYYGGAEPWVSVETFGTGGGFKVVMDLSKESAEWSWFDTQYEAYVNFEDGEGNLLASIFCSCTYKEGQSGNEEAKVSFVNPDVAAQVGMSLTGSGNTYTLTFANPTPLDPMYASMCGFQIDGGGQQANFQDGGWGALNVVKHDEDETLGTYFHVCPLDMSTFNPYNLTVRNYTIDAFSSNWEPYTINVVLDWVVEADANALVKLCMPEMAPQCGVSLTGSGNEYVYTFYGYSALFDPDTYSPYCGLVIANATSVTIAGGDYFTIQKGVNYSDEEYYYVTLVNPQTFNPNELTQTEFPITAQLADGTIVTVTLTFANGNGGVGGGPELR